MLNYDLRIFGTNNEDSTRALARQVANVVLNTEGKHDVQNLKWALPTIHGIGPKDELEGLLAVQMMGVHSLAIECLKRASREDQTTYGMDVNDGGQAIVGPVSHDGRGKPSTEQGDADKGE
jgi:hypothetical protein